MDKGTDVKSQESRVNSVKFNGREIKKYHGQSLNESKTKGYLKGKKRDRP